MRHFCRDTACSVRETHVLLDELAEAVVAGKRRQYVESLATVPLLIIDLCEVVSNVELRAGSPANWRSHRTPPHI